MSREWRKIREQAGVSRDKAAVLAGVSYPTARLFEVDPAGVKDPKKRAALETTYRSFSAEGREGDDAR